MNDDTDKYEDIDEYEDKEAKVITPVSSLSVVFTSHITKVMFLNVYFGNRDSLLVLRNCWIPLYLLFPSTLVAKRVGLKKEREETRMLLKRGTIVNTYGEIA